MYHPLLALSSMILSASCRSLSLSFRILSSSSRASRFFLMILAISLSVYPSLVICSLEINSLSIITNYNPPTPLHLLQSIISFKMAERKTKFLTKAQRQQLRLKKEREEGEQLNKYIQLCEETKKMYSEMGEVGDKQSQPPVKMVEEENLKEAQKEKKKKRKKSDDGSQSGNSRSRSRDKEKVKEKKTKAPRIFTQEEIDKKEQEEKQQVKMQYMGLKTEKRKMFSFNDSQRNVLNFEWSDKDDTTQNASINYMNIKDPSLLFGRGLRAGIDAKEQTQTTPSVITSKYDKMMEHYSVKRFEDMTDRDWRIFREDNDIITQGGRIPNPIRKWNEAKLQISILDAVKRLGFETPRPIQMQAIPIGLLKKDLIALAPTGQGKTLAYLIPLISYLEKLPVQTPLTSSDGPYGLIMVPSRELAQQIGEEFQKLTLGIGSRCQVMVGGKQIEFQALSLQKGCEVIIGTPGRLRDLIEKRYLNFNQCSWVVLDEADKMIDMDMEPDVRFILESIGVGMKSEDENVAEEQEKSLLQGGTQYRVTHLFSATMPDAIQKIARTYLRSYCFISIGEPGSGKKDIQQHVEIMNEQLKKKHLGRIMKELQPPVIIFVNQKRTCEILSGVLEKWNISSIDYHGGKSQEQREYAVENFKKGKYHVLLATDLASRGLHVEGVTAVINFDAPNNIQSYVHRIGRTGRAGKKGKSYTFLTSNNQGIFYELKDFLVKNNQTVPDELQNHPASKVKPGSVADYIPRRKQIVYSK